MPMVKRNRRQVPRLQDAAEAAAYVSEYAEAQLKYKQVAKVMEDRKAEFNKVMETYFEDTGTDSKAVFEMEGHQSCQITITRVQNRSISFSPGAVAKALGKKLAKRVINKRYEVVDMPGCIAYLKELGADPEVFKSFLSVTESVDEVELDRLYELGKYDKEQLAGTYTIDKKKPYFRVQVAKPKERDDG